MPLDMRPGADADRLAEALALEADGQRLLLAGDAAAARAQLREAADRYRQSWEAAPPRAFGRLIGMVKASILAGDAEAAARYVFDALGDACDSAPSCYAIAIAALVVGDDARAAEASAGMREGSEAMVRAADAIAALASGDAPGYEGAVREIVSDFERREEHLTGVPIADTALMLERLAGPRDMSAGLRSPLLPPA